MTKEFTISINGVTLSVDAVEALLARLDALDNKINSISGIDTSDLKSSLQDIRKELETNVESWEDISDKIEDVSVEVNKLERSYKTLDNPLKSEDIKNYDNELKSVSKSLNDIDDIRIDSSDIDKASTKVNNLANNLKKAEDLLGTKLNINIGGLALEFDDVNQAIGILEDKLYLLANSGLRNTQLFKDITALIVNLRTAVKQVDIELENAFSGGLTKAIKGVQGLTAVGSVTSGIGGLFGVEGIDESILKFASLSLVLNGLKEIQELLKDSTGYLALVFGYLNNAALGTLNIFTTVGKGINTLTGGVFNKLGESITNITNKWKALEKFSQFKMTFQEEGIDAANRNLVKMRELLEDLNTINNETNFNKVFSDKAIHQAANFGDIRVLIKELKELDLPEEEFNKAIDYILEFLRNLDPTTKKLNNLRIELKELGVPFKLLNSIDFSGKLNIWQRSLIGVVNGIKAATVAVKAFAKSTIVFALIQVAIEAISWAIDKLVSGFKLLTGRNLSSIVGLFETTEKVIELTNQLLNKYKLNLQTLVDTKVISNQTRLNETIEEYNYLIKEALDNLKNLKNAQALSFDTNNTFFTGADIQTMEEFTAQFELLQKAVLNGTDRFKAMGKETTKWYEVWKSQYWYEVWNTASDAASDYASALKAIIEDIQYRINNLDLSKGESELKEFFDVIESPAYLASLANIEKLFPEDEYAKVLAANIKLIREYYNEIQNLEMEAAIEALNVSKLIQDNETAAIRDRFLREREELRINQERELEDAADNAELKYSIELKYATLREALLKDQANEVRNILNLINANEIAAMQDGLDKRLAELELSRQQEIDAARDSEIKVGELILAINKKYDALILEVKTEFYKQRSKLLEDYSEQYRQLWNEVALIEADIAQSRITNRYEDKAQELGYTDDSIENVRKYYDEIRNIANEEARKIADVNIEKTQYDTDESLNEEKRRNKERLEVIEENYKEGLISKEDYDKAIQKETDTHYKLIDTITRQGEQKIIDIQREYDETARNNNTTAINERINSIRDAYSNIDVEYSTSELGVIDYVATKKSLNQVKKEYTDLFNYIKIERENLQLALDRGDISFGDFRQAKRELDNLEKDIVRSQKEISENLDTLLSNTIASVTMLVSSYLGVLGGLWSTYNEILMARIEQELEVLDREYDMLEEAFNKQEALTLKHTNKLKDIEDELKTSRGDRRAHLIDLINAEREAMLASLAEELRIEKLKEINQKKQDALEKKRREQEKKNSIVQATINTFTAVTNALAVLPWFVGLALSAVALAMGMAQVANIKKQKYASGGLLKGNSHSLGGIPVGNTGIEVEGNEYIVNKKSTSKNLPLIDYINTSNKQLNKEDIIKWFDSGKKNVNALIKNKYATGGIIPTIPTLNTEQTIVITDDRPIVALIVDIVNKADNYRQILILSGLS